MAPNIRTLRPDQFFRDSLFLLTAAYALLVTATSNALAADTPSAATDSATASAATLPAEITGTGTVIDADSGQPVAGAKVTISEFGPDNVSRHHECLSHGDGKFEFTVPTDHAVTDSGGNVGISVTIDFKHPNYVLPAYPSTLGWVQVALARPSPAALLRQLQAAVPQAAVPQAPAPQAAARPLVESTHVLRPLRVVRANPVAGILQSPDGKPVPGVRIYAFSSLRLPPEQQMPRSVMAQATFGNLPEYQASLGKFQDDTTTDGQGRFQLQVPAAGETLLSIWPAKDFALNSEYIADKRGDVGTITLKPGRTLTGRIVGADDKPLAGVYMYADAELRAPTADRSAPQLIQAHALIWRATKTDADGDFTFAPLPPGQYLVEPHETASDLSTEHRDPPPEKHPLLAYFAPQKVILTDDKDPEPIEIRPAPMVQITGRVAVPLGLLDAVRQQTAAQNPAEPAGRATPRVPEVDELRQFGPTIQGLINGFRYQANAEIDVQGNFKVRAPRGLTDGILYLHSPPVIAPARAFGDSSRPPQPKWRTDKDKPFVEGEQIPIGRVDTDISGIEIVYPDPPASAAPAQPRAARAAGS
jgi:hypothetical protein